MKRLHHLFESVRVGESLQSETCQLPDSASPLAISTPHTSTHFPERKQYGAAPHAGITAAVFLLVAVLGCVAFIGLESELLLSERLVFLQRAETTSAAQVVHPRLSELAAVDDEESTATGDNETALGVASTAPVSQLSSNESAPALDQPTEQPEVVTTQPQEHYDLDELMTPSLIERIERQRIDPLAPVQVHVVWVGDIRKAPSDRSQYIKQGYKIVVRTSAEELLEGFKPYVLKAFRQAIPTVVGYDFLKFIALYKYGGFAVDADTSPAVHALEIEFPSDCDVMFGKEAVATDWEKPVFREQGGRRFNLNRPFQILNWAMAASKPRNKHIKWMIQSAMMHFFGLRDMETYLIQDISGSGLMTDYVAMLHEKAGRDFQEVYMDRSKYYPAEGLCLTDGYLRGDWIAHSFLGSWKLPGVH
ncbi:hypothetical protein Gpo141_00001895 [Globisporangium polare]